MFAQCSCHVVDAHDSDRRQSIYLMCASKKGMSSNQMAD
jgi:hypothetical protein